MKAGKCPSDEMSLTNCAIVSPMDFPDSVKQVEIQTMPGQTFIFSTKSHRDIPSGTIAFSLVQRKWAVLSLNQDIDVRPFTFDTNQHTLTNIILEVDFLQKKSTTLDAYDTDAMAREFLAQFHHMSFTVGQQMVFSFQEKKLLSLVVKDLETADINAMRSGMEMKSRKAQFGQSFPNTAIVFDKSEGSPVNLTGKSKGKTPHQSVINPNWDFQNMGVGGLDKQFNAIFRRAFSSRVFPPEVVEQLGCKHVKGILLYGPPGTGKTLMARQIGKMLNAREPKIVNGPEILDKYVGESEANIRKLFAEAEEDEKRLGPNSGLHIIIFDEIDAICKARGTVGGSSGVSDTVVNQLLSKIDGVEQLNNILVIGMTNRRDMIDEALLRPGRLEIQMEIGLPSESGRLQIFKIHTAKMKSNGKLGADVNLEELSTLTKNFSGAEIEGLVRAAQSTALNRLIKVSSKINIDTEAVEKMFIERGDFMNALDTDIKPAFGASAEAIEVYVSRGIINWGSTVSDFFSNGELLVRQAKNQEDHGLVSILIEGPPNSGKTALAASLAKKSNFPFVKVCSPDEMVGFSESAKCAQIRKFFDDAYRSELSCLLVDNVERLLDYGAIGPRYSNIVLQALLVLLTKKPPKGRKLLVLCTTSRKEVLKDMEMLSTFTTVLHISNISSPIEMERVLEEVDVFSKNEIAKIIAKVSQGRLFIGIKKLLALIEMSKQTEESRRVDLFLWKLEDDECLRF